MFCFFSSLFLFRPTTLLFQFSLSNHRNTTASYTVFTQKAKLILASYKFDRQTISVYSAQTARLLCMSPRLVSNGTHRGFVLVGQSLISALTRDRFSFLFPLLSSL